MAKTLYTFSQDELAVLREIVRAYRQDTGKTTRTQDEGPHRASNTYIAKPQDADGIPGATEDTGTPASTIPGKATCDIYRIINPYAGTPELQTIDTLSKEVFNLSSDALPQEFMLVTRDKGGRWIAVHTPVKAYPAIIVCTANVDFVSTDATVSSAVVDWDPGGKDPDPDDEGLDLENGSGNLTFYGSQGDTLVAGLIDSTAIPPTYMIIQVACQPSTGT